jgi:hypothetical protein
MLLTYDSTLYHVDDGRHLAKFIGVKPYFNPTAVGKDGQPIPPGLMFEFEIVDGECRGKICSMITPQRPTPKNKCGMMVTCLTQSPLEDGVPVEIDRYRDLFYMITVDNGRLSDRPPPQYISGSLESALRMVAEMRPNPQASQPSTEPLPY